MFKQIDWMLLMAYFKAYFIFLVSLLTLYIVIDLFTHLDDFVTQNSRGLPDLVKRIVVYYGYRLPQLFDRLCEAIALLAAMFTVVMMQAHNEHLPLLSAGVPTRRIITPVLVSACLMLLLAVANQELIIPRIADKLSLERNDPDGVREVAARAAYEPNLIHLEGDRAARSSMTVRNLRVLIPESINGNLIHITAREARYIPGDEPQHGRWEMFGCHPRDLEDIPGILEVKDGGRYVLHTRQVDFEALTRDPRWHNLASTQRLYRELQRPESTRLASIAVLFHTRLTRPLLGAVLIFLGLSLILRDQTRNIIISSGQCIILCAAFYTTVHTCKMLGDGEILTPTLAAWLPILLFAPFAVVQFDAIQT
jgi:lipopolysaccharide export system permease protein